MLRLHTSDADVLPEPPLVEAPWRVMTAPEIVPPRAETLELRKPGSPGDVVRIGPTVTQVAGFGRHGEVARWIAGVMPVAPIVIGAEAFDDLTEAQGPADRLDPSERQTLVDRVLELAEHAAEIEYVLERMAEVDDVDALDERVAAAAALAVEWDAFASTAAERRPGTASREIELRARTTELLRRLPGTDAAADLRDYADELMARRPNPDAAVAMRSELDRVEAEGRDLVARIDSADGIAAPTVRIEEIFGSDTCPVIVDGDLLYAVTPNVHDLLLDKLREESERRRVVVVLDDTTLDAWLTTVPDASVWTTGHLHLVPPMEPSETAGADSPAERAGKSKGGRVSKILAPCEKHPSELTRLVCGACGGAYCSACLVRINTKEAVLCIDCALHRGTGVKRRRR